jgi:twitching motility protein PilT
MQVNLEQMLRFMLECKASDLHLRAGAPPLMRVHGILRPLENQKLSVQDMQEIADHILTDSQKAKLQTELSADSSYSIERFMRFRVNVFQQRNSLAAIFRSISTAIPTVESLGLPQIIKTFSDKSQGLVLVAGPTGSGKSTTIASMIEYLNQTKSLHVITIEDPIEFLFLDNKSYITQREIGIDTPSFEIALKNAMRQDPDVIFVGEMRSLDTITTAISASETGHLVFSTIHSNNAYETVSRIVDAFPVELRNQVRTQLADVLLGAISQRLVPRKDGKGRVAAVEILIASPRIKELIAKNELKDIRGEIENSVTIHRMQSLEQSLVALIANKMVTYEDALKLALVPNEMTLMMDQMGINKTGDFHLDMDIMITQGGKEDEPRVIC